MSRRVYRWFTQHPFTGALLVLLAVAVPGFLRLEAIAGDQQRLIDCTTQWADATTARAGVLSALGAHRADALDQLVRATAADDSVRFNRALGAYLEVSDAYQQALAENQPPPPPELHC